MYIVVGSIAHYGHYGNSYNEQLKSLHNYDHFDLVDAVQERGCTSCCNAYISLGGIALADLGPDLPAGPTMRGRRRRGEGKEGRRRKRGRRL